MSTNNKYLDGSGVRHLYHNIIKPYVDGADSAIKTDVQILSEKCAELEQRMIPITHHELVSLRDAGNLIPGMQYHITDYEFTTMSDRWKAKSSTFDIIVTADDDHTLNEDARAVAREHVAAKPSTMLYAVANEGEYQGIIDDTEYYEYEDEVEIDGQTLYKWRKYEGGEMTDYFVLTDTRTFVGITADNPYTPIGYGWTDADGQYPEGGSHRDKDVVPADGGVPEPRDYAAWELKYTVDNILWSRRTDNYIFTDDELLFESRGTIDIDGETWYLWYNSEFDTAYEEATQGYLASLGLPNIDDGLSVVNVDGGTIIERGYSTCLKVYSHEQDGYGTLLWLKDEYRNEAHYDHHNALFYFEEGDNAYWTQTFNNGHDNKIGYCFLDLELGMNVMGYGCYNNKLGNSCSNNTFGSNCSSNTFGSNCSSNTFGDNCSSNTFGSNCSSNTFGDNCSSNTFGSNCSSNTFGDNCSSNTFDLYCISNTFGSNCSSNTFGDNCQHNTFGYGDGNNMFGSGCNNNKFGKYYTNNKFGNYCSNNTVYDTYSYPPTKPDSSFKNNKFGNYCSSNKFDSTCQNNTFGVNCSNNTLGWGVSNNTLGTDCNNNKFKGSNVLNSFGNYCSNNTFDSNCCYNTFDSCCHNNKFGSGCDRNKIFNYCSNNTFGSGCSSNWFGNSCSGNTFGNSCSSNSFGESCSENSFGESCDGNSFGNRCGPNSFGNGCCSNSFGNACESNSFGNGCLSNSFGNICNANSFGNICTGNSFGNRCYNISILTQDTKYTHVLSGTNWGKSTDLTIPFEANVSYSQYAGYNSSGELKIWTPADLV